MPRAPVRPPWGAQVCLLTRVWHSIDHPSAHLPICLSNAHTYIFTHTHTHTLQFLFCTALAVTFVFYRIAGACCGITAARVQKQGKIDVKLVLGAMLFGVGWGLTEVERWKVAFLTFLTQLAGFALAMIALTLRLPIRSAASSGTETWSSVWTCFPMARGWGWGY